MQRIAQEIETAELNRRRGGIGTGGLKNDACAALGGQDGINLVRRPWSKS